MVTSPSASARTSAASFTQKYWGTRFQRQMYSTDEEATQKNATSASMAATNMAFQNRKKLLPLGLSSPLYCVIVIPFAARPRARRGCETLRTAKAPGRWPRQGAAKAAWLRAGAVPCPFPVRGKKRGTAPARNRGDPGRMEQGGAGWCPPLP
ncbi:hypothetical protein DSECCO2_589180 [anaerobic digester metagenome]